MILSQIYQLCGMLCKEEMTAIKVKTEKRIILDFSDMHYSKNKIKTALRKTEIVHARINNDFTTVFHNDIKIGMYTIHLHLPFDSSLKWSRLKDYGDFEVSIFDTEDPKDSRIDLKRDQRFRAQYWIAKNFFGKLRIKHLIDMIVYCQRLNKLRAFL
jgi:hypothetical protein